MLRFVCRGGRKTLSRGRLGILFGRNSFQPPDLLRKSQLDILDLCSVGDRAAALKPINLTPPPYFGTS